MSNKPINNTLVHVEVNGIRGVALQPFEKPTPELLDLARGKERALFIDLAASPAMKETIEALQAEGVEVVAYRDHHYAPKRTDPRDQRTAESADAISVELGDKARFETRENAPSCARLVELGEATRKSTRNMWKRATNANVAGMWEARSARRSPALNMVEAAVPA